MSHFNTCAVCDTAIGHQFLMCPAHWHLVPRAVKSEVYRCWIDLRASAHLTTGPEWHKAHEEYQQVRQAAIDSVKAALKARQDYLLTQADQAFAQPTNPKKGHHRADHE